MSEIILTTGQASMKTCPFGGTTSPRNCGQTSCMFWAATNRMDEMAVGYCSLATLARKICEEDFHISETLGTPPEGEYVNDGVRRIDRPVMVGEEGTEVLAESVALQEGDRPDLTRLRLRRPRLRNQQ
jgi:hypothetical protein